VSSHPKGAKDKKSKKNKKTKVTGDTADSEGEHFAFRNRRLARLQRVERDTRAYRRLKRMSDDSRTVTKPHSTEEQHSATEDEESLGDQILLQSLADPTPNHLDPLFNPPAPQPHIQPNQQPPVIAQQQILQIKPLQPVNMAEVRLRAIQPEPFYGLVAEDALEWMTRLTAYFTASKTAEDMKATVLSLLLRNVALVWFKELPLLSRTTADEFETLLEKPFLDKFNGKNVKWMTRQRMEARIMKPSETVDEYIREMICMASRLAIDGTALAPSLIRGLRSDIKLQLMALQPDGFDDTVEKIRLAETIANMRELGATFGVPTPTDHSESQQISKLERKVNDLTRKLNNVKLTNVSETPPSPTPRQKQNPRREKAPQGDWRSAPQDRGPTERFTNFQDRRQNPPLTPDDFINMIGQMMYQRYEGQRQPRRPRQNTSWRPPPFINGPTGVTVGRLYTR
jgi:hypothetical protein